MLYEFAREKTKNFSFVLNAGWRLRMLYYGKGLLDSPAAIQDMCSTPDGV